MGLIHGDRAQLREEEPRVEEQTLKVAAIEDDGVVTTSYNSISNTLYDLADSNSKTSKVVLPQGTTISLAASTRPGVGSYRATFEVAAKNGTPQFVTGTQVATDLAYKLDLLQLSARDKAKLLRLNEAEQIEEARRHLPQLEEIEIHVSGYVTKSGKHVGAYSQIRKKISSLGPGQSLHLPDGISVKRSSGGYVVGASKAPQLGGVTKKSARDAADDVAVKSAGSTDPKSIGGRVAHSIDKGTDINDLPNSGDNPKLPGTPHPQDVAHRAAKARKEAVKRLPSRKQRAENERKAAQRLGKPFSDDTQKKVAAGDKRRAAEAKARREHDESPMPGIIRRPSESDAIRAREGRRRQEGKTPSGLPLPDGAKNSKTSGSPGQVDDPARADHRSRPIGTRIKLMSSGDKLTLPEGVTVKRENADEVAFRVTNADGKGPKGIVDAQTAKRYAEELIREAQRRKGQSAAATIDRDKARQAKSVAGHPAAKARRRHKGLAESAFFGN